MFKVNKRNTRKRCESSSGVFIVIFEHISQCSSVFTVNFEQVNACWAISIYRRALILFKFNKRNTRKRFESRSGVFIVITEHISHCSSIFIFNFEQVNAGWAISIYRRPLILLFRSALQKDIHKVFRKNSCVWIYIINHFMRLYLF